MEIVILEMPNGIKVNAVVIKDLSHNLLCYAQNRLFTLFDNNGEYGYNEVIVDYCVIPEYDEILMNLNEEE